MKKLLLGMILPVVMLTSCDFDGTKEAAEAGRRYAQKEYEWACTSPSDPDYSRLEREMRVQRDVDYAKYGKDSKQWKAYEDARMEMNRSLY